MTDILSKLAALTAKDQNGPLPCPVCDRPAKIWTDARTFHRHWRAGCSGVSCVAIKSATQPDAIARWNARPREQALIALVQEAAAEIERLRDALNLLCPNSLSLALKSLDTGYDEMDLHTAKMHISCELQRTTEAITALNPQESVP